MVFISVWWMIVLKSVQCSLPISRLSISRTSVIRGAPMTPMNEMGSSKLPQFCSSRINHLERHLFCCHRVDLRVKNHHENAGICSRRDRFSAVAALLLEMELKQYDFLAERRFLHQEQLLNFENRLIFGEVIPCWVFPVHFFVCVKMARTRPTAK